MRYRLTAMVAACSLSALLLGCYPDGPDYTEDLDIVLTNYEKTYDFKAKGTYARPDKIVKITGNLIGNDEPSYIPDKVAAPILAQIDKNMAALGWAKVELSETSSPDILLTPASWETTTIYYYYDYWYWWYGGYYPGWGYPSYPTYASSYSTGTLLMNLVDPAVVGADGNAVTQWTGAVNGILTGAYDAARVNKGVDQAFTQSPYLKTN